MKPEHLSNITTTHLDTNNYLIEQQIYWKPFEKNLKMDLMIMNENKILA